MPNLFIIGNGFDLAHGLETKYSDFYNYLSKVYPGAEGEELFIPETYMQPDGGYYYDDFDVVNLLKFLINNAEGNTEWNNVESSVGEMDYKLCFDNVEPVYDKNGELDDWKTMYAYEDYASLLIEPLTRMTSLFEDWIQTISISDSINKISKFDELIEKNTDFFLTFNYTDTLEIIYNATHVCHIHGRIGEQLYFGHGVDYDFFEEYKVPLGTETAIQAVHNHLKKDTSAALHFHQQFFKNLSGVVKVYTFGFSFSDVDLIYIKEICKNIDVKSVKWYIHEFDKPKRKLIEAKIRNCGFRGEILEFITQ